MLEKAMIYIDLNQKQKAMDCLQKSLYEFPRWSLIHHVFLFFCC